MKFLRLIKFGIKFLFGYKLQGIGLIVTRKCNLTCSYCKIKDNSGKKKELTKNEWFSVIENFVKNKHSHFIFTGGEPLIRSDIYELINYASKFALTSLITNTFYLSDDTFPKLKNLDFLTFSCDSLSPSKKFEKNTLDKISLISKWTKILNIKATAIVTVTSKNVTNVPLIIKKLNDKKISVLLSLIHSSKSSKYEFRNYTPYLEFRTKGERNSLIKLQKQLLIMKKRGCKILESESFLKNMVNYASGSYKIDCPATNPFFTIDCDGFIKPCHDIKASKINAVNFNNYKIMKKEVSKMIPKNCNCYYDCYFNSKTKLKNFLFQLFNR